MPLQYYNGQRAKDLMRYVRNNMHWKVKNILQNNKHVIDYHLAVQEALEYACETNKIEIVYYAIDYLNYIIPTCTRKKVLHYFLKNIISSNDGANVNTEYCKDMDIFLCIYKDNTDVNNSIGIIENLLYRECKNNQCCKNMSLTCDICNKTLKVLLSVIELYRTDDSKNFMTLTQDVQSFVISFLYAGKQHDLVLKILNEKYPLSENSNCLKVNTKKINNFTDIKIIA